MADKKLDLIDRQTLSEELSNFSMRITGLRAGKGVLDLLMTEYRNSALRIVDEAPTVDATPVVHGRWVKDEQSRFEHRYNCSACNYRLIDEPCNYCPNCGAKMDRGAEDA